jgi:predicted ester cyclase
VAWVVLLGTIGASGCAGDGGSDANMALVRGYMEEILNQGNLTAAERYFPAEGFVLNGRTLTVDHIAGLRQSILDRFPDFQLTIDDQFAAGDKVATRVTFSGTHQGAYLGMPATGRRVVYTGIAIDRIEGGRVVEGWHQADELGLLQQLGVELGQ